MIHKFKTFNEKSDNHQVDRTDEGMEYILYLLRKTIKNKGVSNFTVECFEDYNISITIETELKERLSEISSIFSVITYLKTDIIPQYQSDFYQYQTKGKNILEFEFILP